MEQYKGKIAQRITHVIDCEAYTFKTKVFFREVSVWNIATGMCKSYQLYIPNSSISDAYFAIHYQIQKIHGLPIVREKYDDFYHYYEVLTLLRQEFMQNADLIAYKGGDIEKKLLNGMGFKSINLEILGCERYDQLLSKYGIAPKCCCYHLSGDYHCSKHEVRYLQCLLKR